MSQHAVPRKVIERLLEGISNRRWSELHELYADDAVVEYPFALPAPTRLEGREAIRSYFAAVARYPLELHTQDVMMYETNDAEVIVVEWDYNGLVTTTGRSFRVSNIQVSRVRDGLIVSSRDYHDHVALAEAVGRLPGLIAGLSDGETRTRGA